MLSSVSLFVCALVCGVFWRVYIYQAWKSRSFTSVSLFRVRDLFYFFFIVIDIFVWRVSLFLSFLFFGRCFQVRLAVKPSGRDSSGRPSFNSFSWLPSCSDFGGKNHKHYNQVLCDLRQMETLGVWSWPASFPRVSLSLRSLFPSFYGGR